MTGTSSRATPSRAIVLFGTEEPPAETRLLTAGPLTAELDAGNLRYICYGGREAIRAISYVVRDQYWGTFNPTIADFEVEEGAEGFTVRYNATCGDGAQSLSYSATITGTPDGRLAFEAVGTPGTDFLTNRTGFVVLHPVDGVSGQPVEVLDVGGTATRTVFPDLIDPKQPIMDIRALTHEFAPGVKVVCTMEGDTFEMEDQRNWTDASYKTYVRPLGLPHPYTIAAGEALTQSVVLTLDGAPPAASAGSANRVVVEVGEESGSMPRFGMALEARHAADVPKQSDALAGLSPGYLSCYLDMRDQDVAAAMAGFKAAAELLDAPLALELVVEQAGDLATAGESARAAGLNVASVAASLASDLGFVIPGTVFPDTKEFDELFAAARTAFPGADVGGGNFVYFTELNRKHPPFESLDFVCHGTSALVHAADDRSVTETIECLPCVVKSARALFGERRYRIGPAGIGSRSSPFGNEPTPNPNAQRVTMTRADPRQRGLLGAAWHLGYAARAAAAGVDEVTLGAPIGEFGLVHHRAGYAQPWYDESESGLFPAYHVMRHLYPASGAPCRATTTSAPRDVQAVAFGDELWLANLTGEIQSVAVEGISPSSVCVLDEGSFVACARNPDGLAQTNQVHRGQELSLSPYAVARLS